MNWEYIAGFFDGEGCVYTYQDTSVRLDISQKKSRKVLEDIQFFLSANGIRSSIYDNVDAASRLRVGRTKDCIDMINGMMPYLIVNRDKATTALALLDSKLGYRTHIPREELLFIRRLRDDLAMSLVEVSQYTGRNLRTLKYLLYNGQVRGVSGRRIDDLLIRGTLNG